MAAIAFIITAMLWLNAVPDRLRTLAIAARNFSLFGLSVHVVGFVVILVGAFIALFDAYH